MSKPASRSKRPPSRLACLSEGDMSEPINSTISPWMPEQDQIRLAALGKLIEELNEASQRAARCIIHGIDEIDPDSGRTNRAELERELADVKACVMVAQDVLGLQLSTERRIAKREGFERWHRMIAERKK